MTIYGYARVSTTDQDTEIQVDRLKEAGCTMIRTEQLSGKSRDGRTELQTLLDFLRAGDVLIVVKADRLGRSTRDVLNIVHELETRGASLRVLDPAIDTAGPMGKVILTVLGMVGEMELTFIKERQRAGIDKAMAAGKYKGRPVTVDRDKVVALIGRGIPYADVAKAADCSRAMVYRIMAEYTVGAVKFAQQATDQSAERAASKRRYRSKATQ
jgi:DNA invertase Pin-like site-specific DNA recombinase